MKRSDLAGGCGDCSRARRLTPGDCCRRQMAPGERKRSPPAAAAAAAAAGPPWSPGSPPPLPGVVRERVRERGAAPGYVFSSRLSLPAGSSGGVGSGVTWALPVGSSGDLEALGGRWKRSIDLRACNKMSQSPPTLRSKPRPEALTADFLHQVMRLVYLPFMFATWLSEMTLLWSARCGSEEDGMQLQRLTAARS